jgi:hypothetical protein
MPKVNAGHISRSVHHGNKASKNGCPSKNYCSTQQKNIYKSKQHYNTNVKVKIHPTSEIVLEGQPPPSDFNVVRYSGEGEVRFTIPNVPKNHEIFVSECLRTSEVFQDVLREIHTRSKIAAYAEDNEHEISIMG